MKITDRIHALARIADEIRQCPLCRKWGTGEPVPGEGYAGARILFLGEAPGREESKTGRPFIGRSGRLLRSMISETGLKEEEVYITSPVKYLPLRGTPSKENVLHGREHLMKQIDIIAPEVIVLMGAVACLAILDRKASTTKEHGTIVRKDGKIYLITCHPAYALRFPAGKTMLREDFREVVKLLRKKK